MNRMATAVADYVPDEAIERRHFETRADEERYVALARGMSVEELRAMYPRNVEKRDDVLALIERLGG
jgi:hypothetical protein